MDCEMLERDLTTAIMRLPREFVVTIARTLNANKDVLVTAFPGIASDLGSHVKALVFEVATGSLDKEEIEKTLKNVLVKLGALPSNV